MANRKTLPDVETLDKLYYYCPVSGKIYRRLKNRLKEYSTINKNGYIEIRCNGVLYLAHRIIWKLWHFEEPPTHVDHKNGNRADNRVENLRAATNAQNVYNRKVQKNNTSGVKGVAWHKQRQKWRAFVWVDGKQKSLGLFVDKQDAIQTVQRKQKELHGEFVNLKK